MVTWLRRSENELDWARSWTTDEAFPGRAICERKIQVPGYSILFKEVNETVNCEREGGFWGETQSTPRSTCIIYCFIIEALCLRG